VTLLRTDLQLDKCFSYVPSQFRPGYYKDIRNGFITLENKVSYVTKSHLARILKMN